MFERLDAYEGADTASVQACQSLLTDDCHRGIQAGTDSQPGSRQTLPHSAGAC